MRTLLAMIKKELLQLKGDKFYLRFLILAPFLQLIVLGYSLTMETTNVATVVCDLDRSVASRALVRSLEESEHFRVTGQVGTYGELEDAIRRWEATIGLYIPPDFSSRQEGEGRGEILALLDAVDGNKALTAYGYLQQIAAAEEIGSRPVEIMHRYRFNPELKNEAFMVPGIVVLIITIITLMIGAMSLVREKETGTLEQLSVTPIAKWQLILGKLIPFLVYAFIEVAIILQVAELVFGLTLAGSVLNLYLAVLIYLFSTLGLGLFVSSVAATQQQALFIAWFFMIFMILLSGFFIPIGNMPGWLQQITRINPLRYMMTIVREIYLKATPLTLLADQLLPMGILGAGIFSLSILKFQKKSA